MPNPKGYTPNLKPFQGKWKSGETGTIRVPKVLHEKLLEIARKLDGENDVSLVICNNNIDKAVAILQEALPMKANSGGAIKAKVKQALSLLEPLVSRE